MYTKSGFMHKLEALPYVYMEEICNKKAYKSYMVLEDFPSYIHMHDAVFAYACT
jgi:hypothetical protein